MLNLNNKGDNKIRFRTKGQIFQSLLRATPLIINPDISGEKCCLINIDMKKRKFKSNHQYVVVFLLFPIRYELQVK